MLYSNDIGNLILGAICNDCSLVLKDKMPLVKYDFEPNQFHKIVFVSVYNLALKGVKEATEVEITEFLENYTSEYNTFTDNNGIEYIKTIRTLAKDAASAIRGSNRPHDRSCLARVTHLK